MYEGLTIVQYDRGNMGEFVCLSLYKKIFGTNVYFEKRKNDLGWSFQNIDGSLDSLLYDYHRDSIDSVTLQEYVFNSSVYENLLAKNYSEARKILNAMINYRIDNPDCHPEKIDMFNISDPNYSYNPFKRVLTRIHNFDNLDLNIAFPGAEIINVYCRPEKRWIFKFLYMYKKHKDSPEDSIGRFSKGFDKFWEFNWNTNLLPKEGAINIDCYNIFLGKTDYFGSEFDNVFYNNYCENRMMLESYGLDYTRDNVSREELCGIIKGVYADYLK